MRMDHVGSNGVILKVSGSETWRAGRGGVLEVQKRAHYTSI